MDVNQVQSIAENAGASRIMAPILGLRTQSITFVRLRTTCTTQELECSPRPERTAT